MNFNPNGGDANLQLPITTGDRQCARSRSSTTSRTRSQEPAGSTGVTSRRTSISTCSMPHGDVVVGPGQPEQHRDPGARCRVIRSPTPAAISSRSRSCPGPNPGHVEFVGDQRHERRRDCQPAVRQRRRHVLSQLVGHQAAADDDRRRRDAVVGAGTVPGPEPAGQRAVQLVRPGADVDFNTDGTPVHRRRSFRTRRSRPPTAATPRSSRPASSSTRPTRPSPASRRPRPTWSRQSAEPAGLLRHLVGRAQRRGRGGA